MFDRLQALLLRILRVPSEPEPPLGDPASTRVFRASPKFYSLRLIGWGFKQFFVLAGLIFGVVFMLAVEREATKLREQSTTEPPPPVQIEKSDSDGAPKSEATTKSKRSNRKSKKELVEMVARIPPKLFVLIWVLKVFGFLAYLTQLAVTYVALRLDFEMRWYMVTDRSLRIRTGLWQVQELTMSFANLQQVALSQGPIQRLFGIADVCVQSAGGQGGWDHKTQSLIVSMHTGFFHGVDNAPEVRDLVLARLRHFQETGLGDPDEVRHAPPVPAAASVATPTTGREADAVLAARELLAETKQLRAALALQT